MFIIWYMNKDILSLKDNIESFVKDLFSLMFFYNTPDVNIEVFAKDKVISDFGEKYVGGGIFDSDSEKVLVFPIENNSKEYLVIRLSYSQFQRYYLGVNFMSFFDFILDYTVRKFVFGFGSESFIFSDKEEFLRNVSKKYISYLFSWLGYNNVLADKLFFLFNLLSVETYERKVLRSSIIYPSVIKELDVSFQNTPEFERKNYRVIRKVLELSNGGEVVVVAEPNRILGLSRFQNFKDVKSVVFSLEGNYWEVFISDSFISERKPPKEIVSNFGGVDFLSLVRFRNGFPEVYKKGFDRYEIKKHLKSVFGDLDEQKVKKISKLVEEVLKLSHGALMVITTPEMAKQESARLSSRLFRVNPFSLFDDVNNVKLDLLRSIASIDGAFIVDVDGVCYGIGIILDGDVSVAEKSSRGARYNSSVRYIESRNNKALAIVISDDGMVDIVSSDEINNRKIELEIESLMSENIIVL